MYLEVLTIGRDVLRHLMQASDEAASYIADTVWYQTNSKKLVWDDLDMCYAVKFS